MSKPDDFDPALDLWMERETDIPRRLIWRCWSEPELLVQWFCPKPWSIAEADVALRPGGRWNISMRNPEGEVFPGTGCVLEARKEEALTFTDCMNEGFRPNGGGMPFVAVLRFGETASGGTRYTALARHATAESRKAHEDMGFEAGWGTAWEQACDLARTL